MKKLIVAAVAAIVFIANIQAQNKKWSLKECIDYAILHNIEVKQSQNRIKSLKVERNTLKSSFLPDLNVGASQRFSFGRALNQDNTYEDSNIQNSSFSASAEMPLFTGFKTSASITRNKFDILAAEANKELIENNLSLNVTNYYFQILLNKEIYRIAQEQIRLTKEQEIRTRILIENGKVPQSQLYDVKAQLADDELVATEGIYASALSCMPQIKQAHYSLQSKVKSTKVVKSGYYPQLFLGAGINTGYYYSRRAMNPSFYQQFKNNMQKSIYFTLSIPLFDRFSTRNQVKTARLEENNARLSLENEKKSLYKDIEKAYMDALAAFEKYESTIKAVAANREAHRYALEKYMAGKSAVYEYNEIKMKLADALSQQSQTKYTYLLKERILAFYSCHSLVE